MNNIYALLSVSAVSLLSLLGALFLVFKKRTLDSVIMYTLAVSSGILLGTVFYDLIPESYAAIGEFTYTWVIVGIISFFILEKFIHWHHHVEGHAEGEKPVAYLALAGDSLHNFLDGAIIGVAYITSIPLGITTTLAVIAHEIPHELGDFAILLFGGFRRKKALWYNFLSALTAIAGTIVVLIFSGHISAFAPYLVAFAAGNFLYIAASDLIPELHEKKTAFVSVIQTVSITAGIFLMYILTRIIQGG
jgi:zinc and cadmium transporter